MSDMTVESLQLEVEASSSQAATSIENLATTLGKLKNATKGLGLNGVSKQLGTLNTTLNSVNTTNADNLNKLANGIRTLSSCGNLKLSSSVATQITNLGNAVRSLDNTNFTALSSLATALTPLSNMGKANLNSFISQLQRLPQAVQALNGVDVGSLSAKIRELVSALAPLSQMGKNNLTSFVTQLKKLPEAVIALQSVNISQLASQIQQLANAFAPLATQMQSIANGFSALPTRLQRLIQQTNRLSTANGRASMSYINLWAKARMAYNAIRIGANVVAGWIRESHEYIENLNLFNVSIGQYAAEAQKYAEQVAEIMGIDPSEWMRNQGVFNTIITGFGVASDKAYLMSKNLTQLGYDISSFYNISFEDAMTKLQSGISGELEPLRRLGYDLSVVSDDYIEIVHLFGSRVANEAELFKEQVEKLDIPITLITEADCIPDHYSKDINGKIIAIDPKVLKPEFQRADRQLYYVTGGFGASANSRGSAVFCTNLHTGKSTRYERMDVMGEIKPERLPEWAKEKAQELSNKKRNKDKER